MIRINLIMLWILFTFEQFYNLQLYCPFLWRAYEVKKVTLIYFLIFEMIKVLCLFPRYKVKNGFKKCGKTYYHMKFLLFGRDL